MCEGVGWEGEVSLGYQKEETRATWSSWKQVFLPPFLYGNEQFCIVCSCFSSEPTSA